MNARDRADEREAEQHAAAMRSGLDTMCACGHVLGDHDIGLSLCMDLDCDCKGFREREEYPHG